jgi:glyceraldehyde-3-phosphate dehydrogenase/erythrose-4-phosphate dehydrogenase
MAMTRGKTNSKSKRVAWTKQHVTDLKAHSKKKTPVAQISKSMKRTPGAIRQKALSLKISIGHRR